MATANGHLDIVKYLIEGCHVDPACVQQVSIYRKICIYVTLCVCIHA